MEVVQDDGVAPPTNLNWTSRRTWTASYVFCTGHFENVLHFLSYLKYIVLPSMSKLCCEAGSSTLLRVSNVFICVILLNLIINILHKCFQFMTDVPMLVSFNYDHGIKFMLITQKLPQLVVFTILSVCF